MILTQSVVSIPLKLLKSKTILKVKKLKLKRVKDFMIRYSVKHY